MKFEKMTVAELIQLLQSLPSDALVVSEGYETGYEPIKNVELLRVTEQLDPEWWDGQFEKSDAPDAMKVVFLDAESKVPHN